MPLMLSTVAMWHGRTSQIVIVGRPGPECDALAAEVARVYLPFGVQLTIDPGEAQQALAARLPWLGAMTMVNDRATAYVCQDFTCQSPVTDPVALRALIADAAAPRRIFGAAGL
jgi:uncharacterized protein YyaL (SSP411 family)